MPHDSVEFSGVSTFTRALAAVSRFAHRSRSHRSRAAFRSAPISRWKARAAAIALWFAAGCVPISSYFRTSSSILAGAAMSGQILFWRSFRT